MDSKAGNQTATVGLTTFTGGITISTTTGALTLPVLTTGHDYGISPTERKIVFNTTTKTISYSDGAYWYDLVGTKYFIPSLDAWYDASNPSSHSESAGNAQYGIIYRRVDLIYQPSLELPEQETLH